ncbi:hypothetical protein GGI05_007842, partial [Coemansia sp. RSA 2603]
KMIKDGKLDKFGRKNEATPADWQKTYIDYDGENAGESAPAATPAAEPVLVKRKAAQEDSDVEMKSDAESSEDEISKFKAEKKAKKAEKEAKKAEKKAKKLAKKAKKN